MIVISCLGWIYAYTCVFYSLGHVWWN